MGKTKRKRGTLQPAPPPKPHLPMPVHEAVAETEHQTKRLLEGCRNPSAPIYASNIARATEILRTCAVSVFDRQVEYYASLNDFVPQWLDEVADQTVGTTFNLLGMFDLYAQHREEVEDELRRAVLSRLVQRLRASPPTLRPDPSPSKEDRKGSLPQQITELMREEPEAFANGRPAALYARSEEDIRRIGGNELGAS